MVKINLYKNNDLVLTKEGKLKKEECIFDNITYKIRDNVLIREDASFRYLLDFKNNKATVVLKEQDYVLNLTLNTLDMKLNNNFHRISYTIESEDVINNILEVEF